MIQLSGKFRSICRFLYILEVASSPGTDQQNVADVQWQTDPPNTSLTAIATGVLCAQLLSHVFATLWTIGHQTPLSMGSPDKNIRVACHILFQ